MAKTPTEKQTNEQLAARIAAGDESAYPQLLEQTKRMIWKEVFRRCNRMGLCRNSAEDLFQEGQVIMLQAARRFDISRGTKFTTLLMASLRGLAQRSQDFSIIHIPENRVQANFDDDRHRATTALSINAFDDEGSFGDSLVDERGHEYLTDEHDWLKVHRAKFRAMMEPLDYRRQTALRIHMQGGTLGDIGDALGICKARARQLIDTALDWLSVSRKRRPRRATAQRQ